MPFHDSLIKTVGQLAIEPETTGPPAAFRETIDDFLAMYEIPRDELILAHDAHSQYLSTLHAAALPVLEVSSKKGVGMTEWFTLTK